MQPSKATAQSFHVPNHSRFGVPWMSQTMNQIKLAKYYLLDSVWIQGSGSGVVSTLERADEPIRELSQCARRIETADPKDRATVPCHQKLPANEIHSEDLVEGNREPP